MKLLRLCLAGAALIILMTTCFRAINPLAPAVQATRPVVPTVTPTLAPTATPTLAPTATPTLVPTVTPTLAPTVTPTPLPDARLRLGRKLYHQGNYTAAIEQFQALLDDPAADADEAAEASYSLGQCLWRNDEPGAAADAFQDFLNSYPRDSRQAAAHFQLAEAQAAVEEWEAAIVNYRAYLDERAVISATVQARIGHAYVQLQNDDLALESYKAALEGEPYLEQTFALREKIAEIHTRSEAYDLAIAQYQKILESARSDSYRAQIEYLMGQAHFLAENTDAAHECWARVVEQYPRTHHAYLSLVELVDAGIEVDEFQRGLVDFYAGVYGPAVQALHRYLETKNTERRDEARYYIGRAYHLSGSYDQAIGEYNTIIKAYPDSPVAADAWLEKARSLAAKDSVDEAIEALEDFVATRPDGDLAPEALWRAANLHQELAAWEEAAEVYRRLQQDYPNSEQAVEALFRAGLNCFRRQDYQMAIKDWQKLAANYPDSERLHAVGYWLSRAYSAFGNEVQAGEWLASAAKSDSFLPPYYAFRAAQVLDASTELGGVAVWPAAQPNLLLDFDETTERAETESWLLTWAELPAEVDDLGALAEIMGHDFHYRRGLEYLSLGLVQEAGDEFEIMRAALRDDALIMYELALATRELRVYKTSIRCASRVAALSPAPAIQDAPRFLQRLIYPTYFDDLLLTEAAARNIDPLLIFALIRQESLFEPDIQSYAQAIGLMQIVPSTGDWIALRLGWEDFAPHHLARPYLNIYFGTWFLAQGLDAFQGDVFAALAAYNAGLAASAQWFDVAGDDPDLFVETIEYSQTLHYVQLIYQHHALYRQIYQRIP